SSGAAKEEDEREQRRSGDRTPDGVARRDGSRRFAEAEFGAGPMPDPQPRGRRDSAEGEEEPPGRAVTKHVAGVADGSESPEADVGAVGNEAKASEEVEIPARGPLGEVYYPCRKERQQRTGERPGPTNDERPRIRREVGARDR